MLHCCEQEYRFFVTINEERENTEYKLQIPISKDV